MSKELEALKRVSIKCHPKSDEHTYIDDDLDTIKQALIQAEEDKNSVERFKIILSQQMLYKYLGLNVGGQVLDYINSYVDDILKQTKSDKELALEIIVKKKVHIPQLMGAIENKLNEDNPLEVYYNGQVGINVPMPLTQEEFDLLKQVL